MLHKFKDFLIFQLIIFMLAIYTYTIDQAIEEFGFENVVYSKQHSRSALYLMVSMAQDHIRSLSDTRLVDWNSSEVTMDWFSDKRAKAMAIA